MQETTSQATIETGDSLNFAIEGQSDQGLGDKHGDDGLPIEAYAAKYLLTEDEVWQRIRRGELFGRTEQGRLLIFSPAHAESTLAELPPLPGTPLSKSRVGAGSDRGPSADFLALSGERGQTPELALLLDHLSLAKEENREILKLTEQSMKRVCAMSDALVQMKDAVIQAKDAELSALRSQREVEIASLRDELAASEREIRRLKQHGEDLEMLARSIAKQAQNHE